MPEGQRPGPGRAAARRTAASWCASRTTARACPEPYREAIFEKFRQVGGSGSLLKDKPKGTGLGLAICRQIVEHFGGRIWAEDAALGGAAVCFTLPAAEASGAAA